MSVPRIRDHTDSCRTSRGKPSLDHIRFNSVAGCSSQWLFPRLSAGASSRTDRRTDGRLGKTCGRGRSRANRATAFQFSGWRGRSACRYRTLGDRTRSADSRASLEPGTRDHWRPNAAERGNCAAMLKISGRVLAQQNRQEHILTGRPRSH